MGAVNINVLGGFRIQLDGEEIIGKLGSSKKKIMLMAYLIMSRNKPVTVRELFETLWPGDDNLNPESALKTMVSRLRKNLSDFGLADAILTTNGAYMWNPKLAQHVDAFEVEGLCLALMKETMLNGDAKAGFERVLLLYKSDLLSNFATDAWVVSKSMYYRNLYLKTVYQYIKLLVEEERFSEVVRVCRMGLDIDPLDATLSLELMSALMKLGRNKEAMAQYEHTADMSYTQLGVKPADEILAFYKKMIHNERSAEEDIREICHELLDGDDETGAFVCDYAIFKDIYSLHMRNLKRMGTSMFIVLVTVNAMEQGASDAMVLDKVMRELMGTLQQNLRRGDTISRYSPSQYALLLPSVSFESGRAVMERVKSAFYLTCPPARYVFNYRIAPVEEDVKA